MGPGATNLLRRCFECGQPLGKKDAFCPRCGARQPREPIILAGDGPKTVERCTFPLHPSPPPLSRAERGGSRFPSPLGRRARDEGTERGKG